MHRSAALVLLFFCISVFAEAAELCAFPGRDGDRQLRGEVNRWLPSPDNTVLEPGARTITVAAQWRGRGALQSGDLLLLIQMQGAAIEAQNNSAYGAVSTDGAVSGNAAVGHFEFVRLESVQALTLQVRGSGTNGGILRRYISRAPSGAADAGVARWQLVRVPQFENLTLTGDLVALPWNGRSGGVLALDVRRELRLNGFTLNAHARGFRGGAALSLTGALGDEHDYRYRAPSNSELAVGFGQHGSKGEGIAGTPRWVAVERLDTEREGEPNALATRWTVLDARPQAEKASRSDGYPDGSMAKGAPGNAGGGGSSLSADNRQSSGGGGGAGGARGSAGRDSANKPRGGLGGAAVSAEQTRLIAGGGGGAGTRRKGTGGNGGAGGGIVFLRAGILNGPGEIDVSGAAGERSVDAGAGGGGGGGSVWIQAAFGDSTEVALSLNGGQGGAGSAAGGSGGDGRVLFGGGVTIQAPSVITNDRLMRDSAEGAAPGYVCRPSGMLISGTLFEDNGAHLGGNGPDSRRAENGSMDVGIAHDGRRQRYEKALQGWQVSVRTPKGELVTQTTTSASGQFSLELSEQWAGKALALEVLVQPGWHAVVAKANDLPLAPFVYEGKGRWAFNAQKEYLQDGLVLGLVRQPDIETPALRTVQPSSTQFFLFRYIPHTQSRARFRYRGELSGASNWTHAFFLDPDCDNASDYVDKHVTGWVPVQAEQPVCVRVRVDVPKGASNAGIFSMHIDAETQLENTPLNLQFAPIKAAIDVSLPR